MATKNIRAKSTKKYLLFIVVLLCAVVVGIGITYFYKMGPSTAHVSAAANIDSQPSVNIFSSIPLQDATVMQSFAYDAPHKIWIFSQLTQAGRAGKSGTAHAADGDMTLTKISPAGKILGYMYLQGFGHGSSIGVEPSGSQTYVWTEAHPTGGYGTRIARFAWKNSATITNTTAGVTVYGVNADARYQTPYVKVAAGLSLIGVRYLSSALNRYRWAIYNLSTFKNRDYTPIIRITQPIPAGRGPDHQGWALNGTEGIISYAGEAYSSANPTGNAVLYDIDKNGILNSQLRVLVAPNLVFREPEGLTNINDNLCVGFASGNVGARRANVFCQKRVQ